MVKTNYDIVSREFEIADLDRVASIWLHSWLDTGLAVESDPTFDEYRDRLLEERWSIRVASIDGEVLAFMAFDVDRQWVRQLFVAPGVKRSGLGTALIEDAKELMPNGFWLRTDCHNAIARRFYEQRGFRLESEAPHPLTGECVATYAWSQIEIDSNGDAADSPPRLPGRVRGW